MGSSLLFVCNLHFTPELKNELVNTHTVILMFIQGETLKETSIKERGKKEKDTIHLC